MQTVLIFFALFGSPNQALASQLETPIYASSTAEHIILATAIHYGIYGHEFLETARCESGLRADAKGDLVQGKPTSFGVFQINETYHPYLTREQMLDPMFNIQWAAQQFKKGKQSMWSCYKKLFGANSG